jgi:hypothetical protein
LKNKNVQDQYTVFTEILKDVELKYIPKISPIRRGNKVYKKTYSRDIVNLINEKHKAWNRYYRCKSMETFVTFKRLRNKVRNLTRKTVINREEEMVKNIKGKPKVFWRYIGSKLKTRSSIPILKRKKGCRSESGRDGC